MSGDYIPAAVLIPLLVAAKKNTAGGTASGCSGPGTLRLRTRDDGIEHLPDDTEVLLTVRTHTVEHHRGQISFPGGAVEPTDASHEAAALRETFEEIGLAPDRVKILAELPEIPTVASRFRVRPFVGIVQGRPELDPNPHEIGEILMVPLRHLLDAQHSTTEIFEREGLRIPMKVYYFGPHRIWGATALMLQILLEKFIES